MTDTASEAAPTPVVPTTPENALAQALGVRQKFRQFMEDEGGPLPDYDDEAGGMLAVLRELGFELRRIEARSTPAEALDVELLKEAMREQHALLMPDEPPVSQKMLDHIAADLVRRYARLSPHNREAGE